MTDHATVRVQLASALEMQFWLGEQIAPASRAGWVLAQVRVDGPLDLPALDAALSAVARRQEALRTAFVFEQEQVVRKVLAEPVAEPLLRLGSGTGFEEAAAALLNADTFDLAAGRVHRAAVAPDAQGATVFLAVHHIAFDGLSQEVFAADLACAYARAVDGVATGLPVLERMEAAELTPAQHAELTTHWRALLAGAADLPTPDGSPAPNQHELGVGGSAELRTTCPPSTWQAVRDQARRSACSPFAVLLAAYGRALAEITGGSDFCVGTPVAARSAGQKDELGCLMDILPVRMPELSAPGVVERVWAAVRQSIMGSALPRYEIVRAVQTVPGGRMPVYQVLFAFENWQRVEHSAGPVRMHTVPVPPVGAVAEVQLQVCELPDGTLKCVVQAPLTGSWSQRLPDLLRAFDSQLVEIAPPATTSAAPHSSSSEAPA
ncbi:condensation domain-containing protein [Kitasatospora sp. NPDC005856]|uniref:condensation domain-containing protein n=1 Tax=Kitasatospora sp. NPDC005856 TaxID=3154566 RepID=UPI00340DFB82